MNRQVEFSGARVLVIGDAMLDHYISGEAGRSSPEAPVPVVHTEKSWSVPGGAANVSRCLSRLGCASALMAMPGEDAAGSELLTRLRAEGVENRTVLVRGRSTIRKTRIMARNQQLLRLDEERVAPPDAETASRLLRVLETTLPAYSALIISDYSKGIFLDDGLGRNLCVEAIKQARSLKIPVLVDPKRDDWSIYSGAACITPNMNEFARAAQKALNNSASADKLRADGRLRSDAAALLCQKYDIGRILLTRGSAGMSLYDFPAQPLRIRSASREVADVSGAGDTVIATLAACVAKGMSWEVGARIANSAAGVAVGKLGTSPVSLDELNNALRNDGESPKLYSLPQLREKITEWRRRNERIVFTNGCFDLLHPGHITLLRQCATFGDRLIVGLNSDNSVRRLKGPKRPIQNQESRAMLLGAIRDVDAIVIFDEDTPENLIHDIRPDCLVKGSDYRVEDIVGADFVQSYGGKVHLVDLVEGCSTTNLAARL